MIDKDFIVLNPLNANPTKLSNTLKQFVDKSPTSRLSVFDHFVKLVLKELKMETLLAESRIPKMAIRDVKVGKIKLLD